MMVGARNWWLVLGVLSWLCVREFLVLVG